MYVVVDLWGLHMGYSSFFQQFLLDEPDLDFTYADSDSYLNELAGESGEQATNRRLGLQAFVSRRTLQLQRKGRFPVEFQLF